MSYREISDVMRHAYAVVVAKASLYGNSRFDARSAASDVMASLKEARMVLPYARTEAARRGMRDRSDENSAIALFQAINSSMTEDEIASEYDRIRDEIDRRSANAEAQGQTTRGNAVP